MWCPRARNDKLSAVKLQMLLIMSLCCCVYDSGARERRHFWCVLPSAGTHAPHSHRSHSVTVFLLLVLTGPHQFVMVLCLVVVLVSLCIWFVLLFPVYITVLNISVWVCLLTVGPFNSKNSIKSLTLNLVIIVETQTCWSARTPHSRKVLGSNPGTPAPPRVPNMQLWVCHSCECERLNLCVLALGTCAGWTS